MAHDAPLSGLLRLFHFSVVLFISLAVQLLYAGVIGFMICLAQLIARAYGHIQLRLSLTCPFMRTLYLT